MTDLAVLAVGFGVIPLASVLIYSFRDGLDAHRDAAWGGLAGILAFLSLSHAMAYVLEDKPFLFGGGALQATLFLVTGLATGGLLGWVLFEGSAIRMEPSRIVWATVAFLGLHSTGDGLVLGRDFVGGVSPLVQVDGLTVSATVVHRFVEGSLVLVPAFAARWPLRSSFVAVSVSLLAIPATYAPGALYAAMGAVGGSSAFLALSTFLAAAEASLALLVIVRGFLPIASSDRGTRWLAFVLIGFIGISLVHFLVE